MGNLVLTAIEYFADKVIGATVWMISSFANALNGLALEEAKLPWVVNVQSTMEALAWVMLGLYIAYKALTSYIMWGEGTADPDGSVMMKSILRTSIYIALSGGLATAVFHWGLLLAQLIAAAPMAQASQVFHGGHGILAMLGSVVKNAGTAPQSTIGAVLGVIAAILGGVVLTVVACFQMAIRGAELIVYAIAAPIAALGQMNSSGGVWSGWWSNLVVLSLSQAVTILCFKGFVGSAQWVTSPTTPHWLMVVLAAMSTAGGVQIAGGIWVGYKLLIAGLMMIGWMVVAIRGPHMLKQWAYHSGVGGGAMYIGGSIGRSAGTSMGKKLSGRIGGFFKT